MNTEDTEGTKAKPQTKPFTTRHGAPEVKKFDMDPAALGRVSGSDFTALLLPETNVSQRNFVFGFGLRALRAVRVHLMFGWQLFLKHRHLPRVLLPATTDTAADHSKNRKRRQGGAWHEDALRVGSCIGRDDQVALAGK